VRLYAPWLGRWCSADPAGLGGGINRNAYVGGNPVRLLDRTGRVPESNAEGWRKIADDVALMPEDTVLDRVAKAVLVGASVVGIKLGEGADAILDPIGSTTAIFMGSAPGHAVAAYSDADGGLFGVAAGYKAFVAYGPKVAAPAVAKMAVSAASVYIHQQDLGAQIVLGEAGPIERLRAKALGAFGFGDGSPSTFTEKAEATTESTLSALEVAAAARGALALRASKAAPKLLTDSRAGQKLLGQPVTWQAKDLQRVISKHGPDLSGKGGAAKSRFFEGEDIEALIKQGTNQIRSTQPDSKNFVRAWDVGREIGTDVTTGEATSWMTVVTSPSGRLVTAHPGR